jgi:hypothetical protein
MRKLFAGALGAALFIGTAAPAWATPPDPAQAPKIFARQTSEITARAHLIYKPDPATPPFEGNLVVIEQGRGLVMVMEQSRGLVVVDARGSLPPRRICDPEQGMSARE